MRHDEYTAWVIAAGAPALAAVTCVLDERHPPLDQASTDYNNYTLGSIGAHNVVIAPLPAGVDGSTPAANVASQMRNTFPSLRFGFLIGDAGGVPSPRHDIRLCDVVVSKPGKSLAGVLKYDFGRAMQGHFEVRGHLNRSPDILLSALSALEGQALMQDPRTSDILLKCLAKHPLWKDNCSTPGPDDDQLFRPSYHHVRDQDDHCRGCDYSQTISRHPREIHGPKVHYGIIASGNGVMQDVNICDSLGRLHDVLCFERESGGLMDTSQCLVIMGISNYADSHRNKRWRNAASASAAAFMADILLTVPGRRTTRSNSRVRQSSPHTSQQNRFHGPPSHNPSRRPHSDAYNTASSSRGPNRLRKARKYFSDSVAAVSLQGDVEDSNRRLQSISHGELGGQHVADTHTSRQRIDSGVITTTIGKSQPVTIERNHQDTHTRTNSTVTTSTTSEVGSWVEISSLSELSSTPPSQKRAGGVFDLLKATGAYVRSWQ